MIDLLPVALLGYLLGSVSGSLLLGRLNGVDIRSMGSGNAGGTNALRSVGWLFALAVVIIDIGKGVIAALMAPLVPAMHGPAHVLEPSGLAAVAGLAAVLGHVWPLYFGFRGGKGAGTAVGVVAVVAPWCLLPLVIIWIVTLLGSGFVGLATVLAGLSLVPSMWIFSPGPVSPALGMLAVALAVLLLFTHRSNLARLKSGTENRFERAQILRRKR